MRVDLFVTERDQGQHRFVRLFLFGRRRVGALAASQAAATPSLSFNSRTMRSAVFLPRPLILESAATSEFTTALLKLVTLIPLKNRERELWPDPADVIHKQSKKIAFRAVMNP